MLCVSVCVTVRTAPLPSVPAGYMDIFMSTKWQEISILLLESMFTFVYDRNNILIICLSRDLCMFYQLFKQTKHFYPSTGPSLIPEVTPI